MRGRKPLERRSRRSRLTKSALICAGIALTASGCAPVITGTAEQMCRDWREIHVRKVDRINSDDTAREIIGNNEARSAWCQGKRA